MPDLVTVDELRTHLKVTGTAEDDRLAQILDGVQWAVESYTHRSFAAADATEYYDGTGLESIRLRRRPVAAVTGVWLDAGGLYGDGPGGFAADKLLTAGRDYTWKRDGSGLLVRLGINAGGSLFASRYVGTLAAPYRGGAWPVGIGNIKVRYTAGYDVPPEDVRLAVMQFAGIVRLTAANGGLVLGSERLGEYAYSMLQVQGGQEPGGPVQGVRNLLEPYVERSL